MTLAGPVSQTSLRCSCRCWETLPKQQVRNLNRTFGVQILSISKGRWVPNSSKSLSTFSPLFPHLAVTPWMHRESQDLILFNPGLQLHVLKCFSWPFSASVSLSGKQWGVITLASFDLYSCSFLYIMRVRCFGEQRFSGWRPSRLEGLR